MDIINMCIECSRHTLCWSGDEHKQTIINLSVSPSIRPSQSTGSLGFKSRPPRRAATLQQCDDDAMTVYDNRLLKVLHRVSVLFYMLKYVTYAAYVAEHTRVTGCGGGGDRQPANRAIHTAGNILVPCVVVAPVNAPVSDTAACYQVRIRLGVVVSRNGVIGHGSLRVGTLKS